MGNGVCEYIITYEFVTVKKKNQHLFTETVRYRIPSRFGGKKLISVEKKINLTSSVHRGRRLHAEKVRPRGSAAGRAHFHMADGDDEMSNMPARTNGPAAEYFRRRVVLRPVPGFFFLPCPFRCGFYRRLTRPHERDVTTHTRTRVRVPNDVTCDPAMTARVNSRRVLKKKLPQ